MIVGGGGMPKTLIAKFIELAGGADAKIVVVPTAMGDPLAVMRDMTEKHFGMWKDMQENFFRAAIPNKPSKPAPAPEAPPKRKESKKPTSR